MMARVSLLGGWMFAVLMSGTAHAQVVPAASGVADRPRPEYQPIGGRIGSFFLYPELRTTAVASDNVLASDANKVEDLFLDTRVDARLLSNFSRHALNLNAYAAQSLHANRSSEDAFQFGLLADGRLDATRDTALTVRAGVESRVQERSDFNTPTSAREPIRFQRAFANVGAQHSFGRLRVEGEARFTRVNYQDSVSLLGVAIDQDFRDVTVVGAEAAASYLFYEGLGLVVRGSADTRRYGSAPLAGGGALFPQRDSSGGRIEAGLRLEFTDLLYGEIRAGYLTRDYDSPLLPDTGGLSFGIDLLWNPTRVVTVRVTGDRRVDDNATPDVAGNEVSEIRSRADFEVARNLLINANARYAKITPIGPVDDSEEWTLGGGARLYLNRQLRIEGSLQHARRSSVDPLREFSENRATLGLQVRL